MHPSSPHPHADRAHAAIAPSAPVQVHVGGGNGVGGVMDRLRAETLPHHQRAESHPWQRAMAKGRLTKAQYAMWLGQMLHVHRTLEAHLARATASNPHVAGVVDHIQFQTPHVLADLEFYHGDPLDGRLLPATAAAVDTVHRTAALDTTRLLGLHYVIEGSKNGGRFIAIALRRAYGLTPGRGDRSIDPYADNQPAVWAKFKADMSARDFDRPACDAIIASAGDMFDAFYAVSEDLARHEGINEPQA
jgi:heme oxygenase